MKIFYHADCPDGVAGAAIVHRAFPNAYIQFCPSRWEVQPAYEDIRENEQVFFVDFAPKPTEMLDILEQTERVTLLDHHQTNVEAYKDFPVEIDGICSTRRCAAFLAWQHLFQQKDIPPALEFLDDYDRFVLRFQEDSIHFINGVQALSKMDPTKSYWYELLWEANNTLTQTLQAGRQIEQFLDVKRLSYPQYTIQFENLHVMVMNQLGSSLDFKYVTDSTIDAVGTWFYDGNEDMYVYRLYSAPRHTQFTPNGQEYLGPNLAKIAKKYGGGGHPGAAGFQHTDLLWKK